MGKKIQQLQSVQETDSDKLYQDACTLIEQAQREAYRQVNETLIKRNWLLGMRIQHDVLKDKRAEYGEQVVKNLSKSLMERYGNGFQPANIYHFIAFYNYHPDIFYAMSRKSGDTGQNIFYEASRKSEIVPSLTGESEIMNEMRSQSSIADILQSLAAKAPIRLTWTHYRIILQESNKEARDWYEQEAAREMWSTRMLQRNVSSQYYHRLLQSQNKEAVHNEMQKLTSPLQDKLEYLKNPVVAEFLGFKNKTDYTESKLEDSLLSHLTQFLMELGKGFAFVDRQKHIHTEKEDYYIDLVFYNYHLRCFVLIDLKTTKLSYQDVGQMDMYVKMYDELVKSEGHNPTIGILLCTETDEDVAHYSVLNGNDQLYAAKYLTYMPTKEELRREIEQQKEFFLLQNKNNSK